MWSLLVAVVEAVKGFQLMSAQRRQLVNNEFPTCYVRINRFPLIVANRYRSVEDDTAPVPELESKSCVETEIRLQNHEMLRRRNMINTVRPCGRWVNVVCVRVCVGGRGDVGFGVAPPSCPSLRSHSPFPFLPIQLLATSLR
ncbi:hypothetical protein J6590_003738 [Homalodisca vitripennis]|nr:hypothetical protein J6590_003738 [Homalodisca vitripennis]